MATTSSGDNLSRMEAQLKAWGARLEEIAARATTLGEQARLDSHKRVEELKLKLADARAKLDEARASGGETWGAFKHGVERSWHDLEDAFRKLIH